MREMFSELLLKTTLATVITTAVLMALGNSLSGKSLACDLPHPKTFQNAKDLGCTVTRGTHIDVWYVKVWLRYLKGKWEGNLEYQTTLHGAVEACEMWMHHVKNISHREEK